MLRRIPKQKMQIIILVALMAAIGVCGMAIFWIGARWSELQKHSARIKQLQAQITDLEAKAKQDTQNQPLLEKIMAFAKPFGETMVTGDPYLWTVTRLREREERSAVRLGNPRPQTATPHPRRSGYDLYNVQVDIEGSYDDICRFIRDFENDYLTSEIRRVDFSASDADSPKRQAVVHMAFMVYPDGKMGPKKDEPKK